jgi:hypothetical protein
MPGNAYVGVHQKGSVSLTLIARSAFSGYLVDSYGRKPNQRLSLAYVTGSHAFKTGINLPATPISD